MSEVREVVFYDRDGRRPTTTYVARVRGRSVKVGIAHCSPRDTLSKVEGRRIARARAEVGRLERVAQNLSVHEVEDTNGEPYVVAFAFNLDADSAKDAEVRDAVRKLVDQIGD